MEAEPPNATPPKRKHCWYQFRLRTLLVDFAGALCLRSSGGRCTISDIIADPAATVSRRPWYRLHLSSWLALIVGLLVAAIVDVPADQLRDMQFEDRLDFTVMMKLSHGWPLPYALREVDWPPSPPDTEAIAVWNPRFESQDFSLWALLVDAFIALGGIVTLVAFLERRRRQRQSLRLQFRLRTLLIGTTVFAICLGWWQWQRERDNELRFHLNALSQSKPWSAILLNAPQQMNTPLRISRLPLWVRVALGEERSTWLGINEPSAITIDWHAAVHEHVKYLVERFPARVCLALDDVASDDEWSRVSELTELAAAMDLKSNESTIRRLKTFAHLKHLTLGCDVGSSHTITDADSAILRALTDLRYLSISQSAITSNGLEQLSLLRRLRTLCISADPLDEMAISALGRFTQLRHLELKGDPPPEAHLQERLERMLPQCRIVIQSNISIL